MVQRASLARAKAEATSLKFRVGDMEAAKVRLTRENEILKVEVCDVNL